MARNHPNEQEAIRNLQRYLRQLSYFDEDIYKVAIDGIWSPETERALLAFQRKNRLDDTGKADEQTWNLLFSQYENSLRKNSPPNKVPFFPRIPDDEYLSLGDVGFVVSVIQYMLNELRLTYDNIENVNIDGTFDENTEAAIREFQKRNLLPANGRVDKETWNKLVLAYESVASKYEQ